LCLGRRLVIAPQEVLVHVLRHLEMMLQGGVRLPANVPFENWWTSEGGLWVPKGHSFACEAKLLNVAMLESRTHAVVSLCIFG
jgi:hypothetical protein